MVTEAVDAGYLRFPEEIKKYPGLQGIIKKYEGVAQVWQRFYRAQKEKGFWPWPRGQRGDRVITKELADPCTTVSEEDGQLVSKPYVEVEPFKSLLNETADRMEEVVGYARENLDPRQSFLTVEIMHPQAQALREGRFADMMGARLNARHSPILELFINLADRYEDFENIKFSAQFWLIVRENGITGVLNNVVQHALLPLRLPSALTVVAGDILIAAASTAVFPFSANTQPSDEIARIRDGAVAYMHLNVLDKRTEDTLKPAIDELMPQLKRIRDYDRSAILANRISVALHEAGHHTIKFDDETVLDLRGNYMACKELLSEVFGFEAAARLPRRLITADIQKLALGASIVKWSKYGDLYQAEEDPNVKIIREPYARAGQWRNNFLERGGAIKINSDNGQIEVEDWDALADLHSRLSAHLYQIITDERAQPGFVESFIELNSQRPSDLQRKRMLNPHGSGNGFGFSPTSIAS